MEEDKDEYEKRVLLVEDDPHIQRMLTTLLKKNGYVVHVFALGEEAFACYQQELHPLSSWTGCYLISRALKSANGSVPRHRASIVPS